MLNIEKATANKTVTLDVPVNFMDGSTGTFAAEFKRVSQADVEQLSSQVNSEVLDQVLVSVSKIGRPDPENPRKIIEEPADVQLEFVRNSPECTQAAAICFFQGMRQEVPVKKTSKPSR